jgi:hypothetical protein
MACRFNLKTKTTLHKIPKYMYLTNIQILHKKSVGKVKGNSRNEGLLPFWYET